MSITIYKLSIYRQKLDILPKHCCLECPTSPQLIFQAVNQFASWGVLASHVWILTSSFTTWCVDNVLGAQVHHDRDSSLIFFAVGDTINMEHGFFKHHYSTLLSFDPLWDTQDPHTQSVDLNLNHLFIIVS